MQTIGIYHEEYTINLTENDSRTMSSSRFTAHKKRPKILEKKNPRSRKIKITYKSLQFTPLFNLLELGNKLNPKSVLMVCVCFFSPQFVYLYCIAFIYLHLCLKSVYLSQFMLCVIYFQKGEMIFLTLNRGKLHDAKTKSNIISIGDHIYPLDKTVSVPNQTGQTLTRIKHICPVDNF